MASLTRHNGAWRIRFTLGKSEFSLFPGKMPKKNAEEVQRHIEAIVAAHVSATAVPLQTSAWLMRAPQKMRARLYDLGLIETPGESLIRITLDDLTSRYINTRRSVKPTTKLVYGRCRNALNRCFPPVRDIARFRPEDAHEFRQFLIDEGKAEATVRKMSAIASQFFADAVERRELTENPFLVRGVPRGAISNRQRDHFVTRETAEKVLAACPNAEWRLIFALARFGGLRCPSEIKQLTWYHVQWEHGRLIVPSPKTAHHNGKAERVVPLFPELRPHLEAVRRSDDSPHTRLITTDARHTNLGTKFKKILHQAGIQPWPKIFHNLRASRETELVESFPIHVVCEWIGNSPVIAAKHYLQVTDEHFEKAVRTEGAE